jgi:hypothetical protein
MTNKNKRKPLRTRSILFLEKKRKKRRVTYIRRAINNRRKPTVRCDIEGIAAKYGSNIRTRVITYDEQEKELPHQR